MRLKKLTLTNFKSHADTVIEFQNITSITGTNNSGKSNLLRALKLVLHHTDWPASWIRYGQKSASVEIEFQDGTVIKRNRTSSTQSVSIKKPSGTEVTYVGKKDASADIAEASGIRKVLLDEVTGLEDLNFIEVHDGPYLLGSRADTVQRKISGILGTSKLDDAKARLQKNSRKLTSSLDEVEKQYTLATSNLNTLSDRLKVAQDFLDRTQKLEHQRQKLDTIIQKVSEYNQHSSSSEKDITNVVFKAKKLVKLLNTNKDSLVETRNKIALLFLLKFSSLKESLSREIDAYQVLENQLDKISDLIHSNVESTELNLQLMKYLEDLAKKPKCTACGAYINV